MCLTLIHPCIYYLSQDTTFQHDELNNNVTDAFVKLATFSTSAAVLQVLL